MIFTSTVFWLNSRYSVFVCQLSLCFLHCSDLGMMEKDAAVQPSFTSLFLVSEAKISLAAVLSLMAVFALLSAAVLLYRKNLSVRVHAASYRTPLPHILYRNWSKHKMIQEGNGDEFKWQNQEFRHKCHTNTQSLTDTFING